MLPPPPAATEHTSVRLYRTLRTLGIVSTLVLAVVSQTAQAQNTTVTFWPSSTVPSVPDSGPDNAVELGMKFSCSQAGTVTGLQFYKAASNTGTHTGHLWSSAGVSLASVTFTGETASGWQQANFATPVVITAGTTYTISYHTTVGHYPDTTGFFSAALSVPPLSAPVNAGVYAYGSGSSYPTSAWEASNYWVQPIVNTGPPPPPAPSAVSVSPASVVGGNSSAGTVTLTSAAPASGIVVGLSSTNSTVPSSVTVTAGSTTATFTVTTPVVTSTTSAVITASYNGVNQTATLTETAVPVIAVTISPNSVTLAEGGRQRFTATVTGTTTTGVTWSTTGGTISTRGSYTAPNTTGTYTVTATSKANTAVSASATVTVTAPVVTVTISPTTVSLAVNTAQQFTAKVTGTSTTTVTWSTTGGTITSSGDYTAPSTTGTYAVTATSTANTAMSASATVTVTAQPTANVIFYDDFSETALSSEWTILNRQGDYTNSELECYLPANVTLTSNGLVETADAQTYTCGDSTHTPYPHSYTSGAIGWAAFTYTYGTLEVKAKMAGGQGPWPAIWLLGYNCQNGWNLDAESNPATCNWPEPGSDEIDFIEILGGDVTSVNQQIHTGSHNDGCSASASAVDQNWHVYDLVWSAGSLVWKIDGTTTCTIRQSYVPDSAMFLIINVAVGGAGGTPNNSTFPQSSQVSYVKVTQP